MRRKKTTVGYGKNKQQVFYLILATPQAKTGTRGRNAAHHAKCPSLLTSGNKPFLNIAALLCVCQISYVNEIRLSGGRGAWSGMAPSSCPEVDLEVIEEYLQEHSLEVQPAHTPASPPTSMGQQSHTHARLGTRIIGQCDMKYKSDNCDDRCFYMSASFI